MTTREQAALNRAISAIQEIDACQGCENEGKDSNYYPCKVCCNQYPNKWRAKEENPYD